MTQFKNMPRHEKIAKLKFGLKFAEAMVLDREDGENYLAEYTCLKKALRELEALDDTLESIRRDREARAFKKAA
ncbi:hypothetical protein N6L24_11625 [Cognatishimia sp. SS12]|uniref:hypothetical protein n=1 Tax=Cognatishimia sp. SS12 TaxID=2979465 RepID=UPI00232AE0A4|nr:hypothetical protein [Cognatishimia sp. SS12]MDC0738930.1 hypothetical protein [Cognatishimia sp. SS12]